MLRLVTDDHYVSPPNPAPEASSKPVEQEVHEHDEPQKALESVKPTDFTSQFQRVEEKENLQVPDDPPLRETGVYSQNPQMPEGVMTSLIKRLQGRNFLETIKDKEVVLSVWDFAGQQLYYASHPVFMSHRAIYILVYNLGKDLDAKAEPRFRQGTREILLDNASNETNLDNLLSWLVSVHCLCHPDTDIETDGYIRPPVIIVGTHADKLPSERNEMERRIQAFENKVQDGIASREFEAHVVKPYFVVDNKKSKDDEGVKKLHEKITEVLNMEPYIPERVPIRWFHFEKV